MLTPASMRISLADALAAEALAREPSRVEVPAYAESQLEPQDAEVGMDMPRKVELSPESMPKKVQLPVAALAWHACEVASLDLGPSPLGHSPHSPPPALPPALPPVLPPTLPPALAVAEPPSSPPALPAQCGGTPQRAVSNPIFSLFSPAPLPAPMPASLPPATPPSLPASLALESFESQPPSSPPSLPADGPRNPGSKLHGAGRCRPCAWFWKPGGCQNGSECAHCHLCPEGEIKARKKARQTMARLGLATPQRATAAGGSTQEAVRALRFLPNPGSEQDSTTGASSEQEWTFGSLSEQDTDSSDAGRQTPPPGLSPAPEGDCAGIELPPGLDAPPALPSLGSALHASGSCQPCAWFWRPASCSKGEACGFCHACPDGAAKAKKKARRAAKA